MNCPESHTAWQIDKEVYNMFHQLIMLGNETPKVK